MSSETKARLEKLAAEMQRELQCGTAYGFAISGGMFMGTLHTLTEHSLITHDELIAYWNQYKGMVDLWKMGALKPGF